MEREDNEYTEDRTKKSPKYEYGFNEHIGYGAPCYMCQL